MNDYSLFTMTRGNEFIILLVYVDDVIITRTSVPLIDEIKSFIQSKFQIKNLGTLKYFLSLEIQRSSDGILMNQRRYALELLDEVGFLDCKPVKTLNTYGVQA